MFNFRWRKTLRTFVIGAWERFQLDFTRKDGQILLHVFKSPAVKNWDVQFDAGESPFILTLHFHKDKFNNDLNFEKFKKSDLFHKFEEVEFDGEVMFFGKSNARTRKELTADIREVIRKVYGMELRDVFYFLRSF